MKPTYLTWKDSVLTIELHPRFIKKREVEAMTEFHGDFTKEHPVIVSYNLESLLRLD